MTNIFVSSPPSSDHNVILPEKISATCCRVISFMKLERWTSTPIPSHAMGVAARPGASVPVTATWAWPDLTISTGFELASHRTSR